MKTYFLNKLLKRQVLLVSFLFFSLSLFLSFSVLAAVTPPIATTRPSIFSTSTDWEALTGLRLSEFNITFGRDRTVTDIGMELYYLDGFPCYGQSESVRAWISPSRNFAWDESSNAGMRIVCLVVPQKLYFAYREVASIAAQGRTKGMMSCEPEVTKSRNIKIRLENCTKDKDWKDFK